MIDVMTAADYVTITAGCSGGSDGGEPPVPLLFLLADTGGGHRSAARALSQALDQVCPGRFAPVFCDPLAGPGSARLVRIITRLYGPVIRIAPWLWGSAYHAANSRPAMWLLRRTLLRLASRPAAEAARAVRPAAIVSFHALTGPAAVFARDRAAPGAAVVTVVTDLTRAHTAWRYPGADVITGLPRALRGVASERSPAGGALPVTAGLPVTRGFWGGPLVHGERAIVRRSLGLDTGRFLVLLTGGGEGSGGIGRRARAILRRFGDVDLVAVCGRNQRLKRRLDRLAPRYQGRLAVTGFIGDMADWLRCCDVVVTKAGPGTIAEAACCGAAMLLTTHVPGQEAGNAELVIGAGAGRQARGVRRLLAEIGRLKRDQPELEAMRAASARLGQPAAAHRIAAMIAGLAGTGSSPVCAKNVVLAAICEHSHSRGGGTQVGVTWREAARQEMTAGGVV
jgi:1,2-diacylglycerol 3-beta-galactosyltransferase